VNWQSITIKVCAQRKTTECDFSKPHKTSNLPPLQVEANRLAVAHDRAGCFTLSTYEGPETVTFDRLESPRSGG